MQHIMHAPVGCPFKPSELCCGMPLQPYISLYQAWVWSRYGVRKSWP